jgi:hypothetical protein
MESEIWKDIPWSIDCKVSNMGGFQSHTGRIFRYPNTITRRYVSIKTEDGSRTKALSRLIMETFVGPCPKGLVVNHKDRNPGNNILSNLECISKSEDSKHWKTVERPKGIPGRTLYTFNLYNDTLDIIKEAAKKDNRSVSNYIAHILINHIKGGDNDKG